LKKLRKEKREGAGPRRAEARRRGGTGVRVNQIRTRTLMCGRQMQLTLLVEKTSRGDGKRKGREDKGATNSFGDRD